MKSAFRTALLLTTTTLSHRPINPNPNPFTASFLLPTTSGYRRTLRGNHFSTTMSADDSSPTSAVVEKQFDEFRHRLEESGNLRDRIKAVASEIESTTRIMYSIVLLVHQSRPISGIIKNLID